MKTSTLTAVSLAACLALTSACTSSRGAVGAERQSLTLQDRYNDLNTALRALPNVHVDGDAVTYRGVTTLTGDPQMRFAAEGRIVGTYRQAQIAYDLNDIRKLRVVKPAEAQSQYGQQGANGVIELLLVR